MLSLSQCPGFRTIGPFSRIREFRVAPASPDSGRGRSPPGFVTPGTAVWSDADTRLRAKGRSRTPPAAPIHAAGCGDAPLRHAGIVMRDRDAPLVAPVRAMGRPLGWRYATTACGDRAVGDGGAPLQHMGIVSWSGGAPRPGRGRRFAGVVARYEGPSAPPRGRNPGLRGVVAHHTGRNAEGV